MAEIVAITSSTSPRRVSAIGSGFAIGLALCATCKDRYWTIGPKTIGLA
jgi:hypothetical protein